MKLTHVSTILVQHSTPASAYSVEEAAAAAGSTDMQHGHMCMTAVRGAEARLAR